ncbi:hypothetical protein BU16DRAFT_289460 [Lophium mytilinum]|uniref:Uncharacterized protein n=1 Tax=Lophium mytilinum TaxID=390894 RepID=A0A6A6R0Q0_9PEZI|nr:hypothetical protein BU16DRAFT_289460 [Lophium mytilinum]
MSFLPVSNMATLESLPVDLALMALLETSSVKDLYSIIRACPSYYRIFTRHKSIALGTMARRSFSPEVFAEARLAFNTSKISSTYVTDMKKLPYHWTAAEDLKERGYKIITEPNRYQRGAQGRLKEVQATQKQRQIQQERFATFLEDHRSRKIHHKTLPELSTSILLCRLAPMMDFFVADYARYTLGKAKEAMKCSSKTLDSREISECERTRIQRAFLRFEAWRRLFPYNWSTTTSPTVFEASTFLNRMAAWEVEEVRCIYYYIEVNFIEIVDSLEDAVVRKFHQAQAADIDGTDSHGNDYRLEHLGLGIFRTPASVEHLIDLPVYIHCLIEVGLPYLRAVLEATEERRMAMVASNPITRPPRETLLMHLDKRSHELAMHQASLDESAGHNAAERVVPMGYEESATQPNAGWITFRDEDKWSIPRWMGAVFWDHSRLLELDLVPRLDHPLRGEFGIRRPGRKGFMMRPPAEQRFHGKPISLRALQRLRPPGLFPADTLHGIEPWLASLDYNMDPVSREVLEETFHHLPRPLNQELKGVLQSKDFGPDSRIVGHQETAAYDSRCYPAERVSQCFHANNVSRCFHREPNGRQLTSTPACRACADVDTGLSCPCS